MSLAALLLCGSLAPAPVTAPCPTMFLGGFLPRTTTKDARGAILVCRAGYAALISSRTLDPVWSAEHLTPASMAAAHRLRRAGSFEADPAAPSKRRAELSDYRHSGFDRGHMAPSGDMPTASARLESFELGNVVPQTARLNRGPWEMIEREVRTMAEDQDVFVITGTAFAGPPKAIGADGLIVPTSTWKVAYLARSGQTVGWICTNVMFPRCARIEPAFARLVAGIELFPALGP